LGKKDGVGDVGSDAIPKGALSRAAPSTPKRSKHQLLIMQCFRVNRKNVVDKKINQNADKTDLNI
jgi:hypothetical protein